MLNTPRHGIGGRFAERAVGERREAAADPPAVAPRPDPELAERPTRRRFTAEYKRRILLVADACREPGEVGALLRREGLDSSHLSTWRAQREAGTLAALERPRGRRAAEPLERENATLRQRLERAEAELEKARKVIEVQGNVSALLGEMLGTRSAKQSTEP
jgi:transposase